MEKFLPEICTIQYGFPFDSAKFSTSEGMPLIRIRDVVRGYSETFTTEEYKEEYIVNKDDLLIGMDGEFNIAKWGKNPALLNQRVCRLLPMPEVDKNYLFYFMPSALKRIEEKTPFVTVKHLSAKELNKVKVPLPPLDAQRRIAAVLDKVSGLIAKRREQLRKLDELVKARFVEMFGDEHGFGRWPCGKVADVADVCVGVVIKPTQYYAEEGVRAFRSLNIGPMYVKDNDWIYFSQGGHLKNQKSVIHKNDVLVVRSGAPGTACVATEEYDGCNAVDIIIARPDTNKVNSVFLAMFTNLPHGMNQIQERTGGAAQQHFNVGGYKALTLIMPPLGRQNEFALFFEQSNKSKLTIQQNLDKLEVLKKALMQQYFGLGGDLL